MQSDSAACLGARVRTLRRSRGLTLKALGSAAGLSHPFLSQLERGLARPSVGSVERIADALGVPIGALWARSRPGSARLVRADEGERSAHEGAPGGARTLSGEGLHARELSGGGGSWPAEPETAGGEVMVYAIRGGVELDLAGQVHVLREGDSLFFDGALPHRLRATGGASARALYVASAA
jgi:transcriptional regulator with XRE-family HTH domain